MLSLTLSQLNRGPMKILFTETFSFPSDLSTKLDQIGINYDFYSPEKSYDFSQYDVMSGNMRQNLDLKQFTSLKWLHLTTAGYDHVDVASLRQRGVLISNGRGVYSDPIAEWVVLSILYYYKKLNLFNHQKQAHVFKRHSLKELSFKKVLILGTGSIGIEIANRLLPFHVNLYGINTSGKLVLPFHMCLPLSQLDETLPQMDVVIMALPATDQTFHLLNQSNFKLFKDDSILINVGRGQCINEVELIEALHLGHPAFAALDVFEEEPLNTNSPLWDLDNVLITPHVSFMGEWTGEREYMILLNNINHYLNQQTLTNLI
jgi:phosphoglycerate dehydrogenase-like enzyme